MTEINERTVVPIGWVMGGFVCICVGTISATFWVSSVNDRLSHIEEKLGIAPHHLGESADLAPSIIEPAQAATK